MQEAVAKYQEEGFSRIYIACAGTNTQKLIDLLEGMFGDPEEPDLEGLESESVKKMWEQAAAAEKIDVEASEGPIPSGSITRIVITSLPVPLEFGLQPEMCPETESIKGLAKRILQKRSPNSIMVVASAPTHHKTRQACILMLVTVSILG